MKHTKLIALLLALVMVLALAACGSSDDKSSAESGDKASSSTEKSGGNEAKSADKTDGGEAASSVSQDATMQLGFYGGYAFIGALDPIGGFCPMVTWGLVNMLYDTLFFVQDYQVTSKTLSSWGWEDDLTLKVTLKDYIYFNNSGDNMVAEDILYSLWIGQQGGPCMSSCKRVNLDKSYVDPADPYTAYLVFDEIYAPAIESFSNFAIVNKSFFESLAMDLATADWYDPNMVDGSGPYVLDEQADDAYAFFDRAENWWGAEEYPDACRAARWEMHYYGDQTTMEIDYINGNLDLMLAPSTSAAEQIAAGEYENTTLYYAEDNNIYFLTLSDEFEEIADVNVRLAIAHALNIDEMTEVAWGIMGTPATGMMNHNVNYFVEGLVYEYDPELAKECLAAAGLSAGDLSMTANCSNSTSFTAMAETAQYYLNEVGIIMTPNFMDNMTRAQQSQLGGQIFNFDFGSSTSCDPYKVVNGLGYTGMAPDSSQDKFPEFCDKISSALSTRDESVRGQLYEEIQQFMYDHVINIPICETAYAIAYNNTIFADLDAYDVDTNVNPTRFTYVN